MRRRDILACLILGEASALILCSLALFWNLPESLLLGTRLALVGAPLGALGVVYLGVRLGRRWSFLGSGSKFVVVGGSNTFIDLGILNLFMYATGVVAGPLYAIFKAAGFVVAVVNSYLWNRNWSFASWRDNGLRTPTGWGKQFSVFTLVTTAGLVLNTGVATLLVLLGPPTPVFSSLQWANAAAVLALIVSTLWNFFAYRSLVFHSRDPLARKPARSLRGAARGNRGLAAPVAPSLTES
jgi:putative flippase GtrA